MLHPHASHLVQPLDLLLFRKLKREWVQACEDYKAISREIVDEFNFAKVFQDAWRRAFKQSDLINAFKASGLSPWNPDRPDYSKCVGGQVNTL